MDSIDELIHFVENDIAKSKQASLLVEKLENMLVVANFVRDTLNDKSGAFKKHAKIGIVNLTDSVEELSNLINSIQHHHVVKKASRVEIGEYDVCPHMAPALHYGDFEMKHMDLSDESKLVIRKFEHELRSKHGAVEFAVEEGRHFGKCHLTGEPGMVVTVKAYANK